MCSQLKPNVWPVFVPDAIIKFSGGVLTVYGPNETASIFATYPSEYLTLGRSFLDQVSVVNLQPTPQSLFAETRCVSSGSGHRHADVEHPVFGRKEEHPGSLRARPCHRCGDCPRHLHVHVWELRRRHQSCSGPGPPPLYPQCRLGHWSLYVRPVFLYTNTQTQHKLIQLEIVFPGTTSKTCCQNSVTNTKTFSVLTSVTCFFFLSLFFYLTASAYFISLIHISNRSAYSVNWKYFCNS